MILYKKHLKILIEGHVQEYLDEKSNMQLLKALVEGCPIDFGSLGGGPTSVGETGAGGGAGVTSTPAPPAPATASTGEATSTYPEPKYAGEGEEEQKADVLGEPDIVSDDELEGDERDLEELDRGAIMQGAQLVQTVVGMF